MRRRALLSGDKKDYLTMVVTTGGDVTWTGSTSANTLSYSKDNGNTWTTANSGTTISVSPLDKVMWKGTPTPTSDGGIGTFSGDSAVRFDVEGNVMSLLFGDNFVGQKSLSGKDYAFKSLFVNNENVVSVDKMVLSATTLAESCYQSMFQGCTSLTTAPELPATTLAESCYHGMFNGCTSLTTAQTLPATTLASNCYHSMFRSCTSLTTAPSLPATTLSINCYRSMFVNCTNLTTAPELPATTLAESCYNQMFKNCTSLTTVHKLPATTLASGCYYLMFNICTSLTTVSSDLLPATTLAENCYNGMFSRCTSLTTAPELPATTLAQGCYQTMFRDCTSLTTAPELPATTLAANCYQEMFNRCASLNSIKCLATDITATNCTYNWVSGVAASGTFIKAASMTSWTTGVNGIPSGWTVEEIDYSKEYLTFTALEAGTFTLRIPANITTTHLPSVSYSIDDGETWTTVSNSSSAVSVTTPTIQEGRKVLWKAVAQRFGTSTSNYCKFTSTGNVEISGNIMSLLYGDDFASQTELKNYKYIFYGLFRENKKLISIKNLVLPATTLRESCYRAMFYACSNLSEAPSKLPATTLTTYCYASMLRKTAITKAPELPAATLAAHSYSQFLQDCTNLTYIKCLATDISATSCTTNWVSGVAATGTFVKAASMTSWTTGVNGIPSGWTVQNA